MTPAEQAMAAAWLAELWPTCRELSREERAEKRAHDAINRAALDGGKTVDETARRRAS